MGYEKADDQSFVNPALVGSGTILPDGKYGEPLPDPTEVSGVWTSPNESPRTGRIRPDGSVQKTAPAPAGAPNESGAGVEPGTGKRTSSGSTAKSK